ncbi:MAG: lytic transglycosylase domain-containing protein [Candidatus Binataceae bacterium]
MAAPVRVPLRIDYLTLDQALKQQAYTAPGGRAELWQGASVCEYFRAANPRFSHNGTTVTLETDGDLSVGIAVGGRCVSPVKWSGIVELDSIPYLTPALALKFRVININLYNPQHQKTLLAGRGFDLVKSYLIPRFEDFSFDLKPGLMQLEDLVQQAATPAVADRVKTALATLRPIRTVVVENNAVRLTLELTVPEVSTASPLMTGPAPPLTPAQVAAWQTTLDNWDAFMVFAVKQLGLTVDDPLIRQRLFDVLMDSRYRLVAALAQPRDLSAGPDPVRILFLHVWTQLGQIVRTAAQRGLLHTRSLEFLSFISAGDALFALDQAAPALGMRVSAGDLRRLARIMAPQTNGNPLAYSFDEDPQLQQLFGVTAPAETPGPVEMPAAATTTAPAGVVPATPAPPATTPSPAASSTMAPAPTSVAPSPAAPPTPSAPVSSGVMAPTPASVTEPPPAAPVPDTPELAPSVAPAPKTAPVPAPAAASSPLSMLWLAPDLLGPEEAFASENSLASELLSLGKKLKLVVVSQSNMIDYQRNVSSLLTLTAERQLQDDDAPGAKNLKTYVLLMRATAWQESCWRQFTLRDGRIRYLESSTGDIGLMQVNKYVWRGLFKLPRLEWDVVYNAGAGGEILMKLMRGAIAKGVERQGESEALARSTYAAYNGGPDAYNRWRRDEPRQTRAIDRSFREKYRAINQNRSFNIMTCAADWGGSH